MLGITVMRGREAAVHFAEDSIGGQNAAIAIQKIHFTDRFWNLVKDSVGAEAKSLVVHYNFMQTHLHSVTIHREEIPEIEDPDDSDCFFEYVVSGYNLAECLRKATRCYQEFCEAWLA
jgi:hypothetical protein